LTDHDLIARARGGDNHAFAELVKRYESQVAAVVIGMLGNSAAADDVGQEVFIRFYKALRSFHGDAALGTYLTRIAINLSLNELKRRKRRRFFFSKSENEKSLAEIQADEQPDSFESQQLVQQALQKLEPEFRAVVVLRLIEGYSTEETAKALKLPLGTVLSRLSRAQKKLQEYLRPFIEETV
jgi:RNA polymerase sigma-70 factor (ECF subfamily)